MKRDSDLVQDFARLLYHRRNGEEKAVRRIQENLKRKGVFVVLDMEAWGWRPPEKECVVQ